MNQEHQQMEVMWWYKPSIVDSEGIVKEPRSAHMVDLDANYRMNDEKIMASLFSTKPVETSDIESDDSEAPSRRITYQAMC